MTDGSPALEVGFAIDFGTSFTSLSQLEDGMDRATAAILADTAKIQMATGGMFGGAVAQVVSFGNASTRAARDIARENALVERSGEGIVRQMSRQIEVFGKSASEVRRMRAEMRAVAADSRGFTELAARIRAASAELDALEAGMVHGTTSAGAHRQAMMGASYQVQDFITQVSMGANPLNAFAVQGAQLAGQFANVEGKAGAVARFFMGPWGLAITGAIMLAGMLTKGLFEEEKAAEKARKASLDLTDAIDFQTMSTRELITAIDELERAQAKQIQTARQAELQAVANANKALDLASAQREAAIATLESLRATEQSNWAGMTSGTGADSAQFALSQSASDIDARIAQLTEAQGKAEKLVRETTIPIMARRVEEATDAAAAATGKFERAMEGLNARFVAGSVDQEAYIQQASRLTREHEAAQEAIRETERADKAGDRAASRETRRLERLGRESDAAEAQIRNLYALADAYRISGEAAMLAEARVAAESKAIKQQGNVAVAIERELQLAIAQRVSSAAENTASMQQQIAVQQRVNDMVAAGLVPAERAAQIVQDQLADLPLLAAIQIAQQGGYTDAIRQATQALEDQQKARDGQRAVEATSAFNSAMDGSEFRLAQLREELRLVGATDEARVRALATLQATRDAADFSDDEASEYIARQVEIAEGQLRLAQQQAAFNQELRFTADLFDVIHANANDAARGMTDAFGSAGNALGGLLTITTGYHAADERLRLERETRIREAGNDEAAIQRENTLFALRSASLQVGAYGDMAAAAQGFFSEGSDGYKALAAAEKAFRAVEFAMSVRAIAQDAAETGAKLASGAARIATGATEAVVNAIKSLPFPLNLAAGAATVAALASIGVAVGGAFSGGGGNTLTPANDGSGTTLGDAEAQSQSIKRSIDALREVDLLTANHSRDMLVSLRSIDNQIGGFASLVLRTGNVNADLGITEGFKSDLTGQVLSGLVTGGGLFTKIPIIGGIIGGIGGLLGSLFGSKKEVVGSGLFAGPQTLADILNGGFDASYYSDVKKTRKFLGVKTGTSYSTQYADADAELENQFTLVLRGFSDAIAAAAGPLGVATSDIEKRLNGFVIDIGKIDTRNLTGTELQEKLTAVFGAAADRMAAAAFPGFEKFQQAGEGMFETLVRVASTVETVTGLFDQLGIAGGGIGIEAQLALVEQFDSLEDLTSATQSYFETFYTREEQAQAKLAQFTSAFDHMGITLPNTLAGFRALVEAQDLTTAAGRETYAMLLQVAPAFADLQLALNGARTAADILAERQDLERKLLELQGDTAALRELELAQLDVSNRALQQQIWAIEDAQEAAKAAEQLREAWSSVGDSIMDEVNRIRGLNGAGEGGSFAQLMGQFNAATSAARTGDLEAAKTLPGLSQSLLAAAELAATSKQELDRVRAQTAASLEATYGSTLALSGSQPKTTEELLESVAVAAAAASQPANDDLRSELQTMRTDLTDALERLRTDNNAGHAATAGNTGRVAKKLDDVTSASGGDAISTVAAA